jgi:tetratricopeptide (TPR) repeat protein
MTDKRRSLAHRRDSSRHFLFSKTDPQALKSQRIKPRESTWKELKQLFPDVLAGKRFGDNAMHRLDATDKFSAMAIKIDHLENGEKGMAAYKAIALELEAVGKSHNGWWGILEHGFFGSYFPQKDALQCVGIARHIQKSLGSHSNQTATIGIAIHPILHYAKHHIMENARKAMEHATFFGPGSIQEFDDVSLNISGDRVYETGDIAGAIDEFKYALQLEPGNVNVHNSLGVCYGVQRDLEAAAREFKASIALEPSSYMALYNLGLVSMLNGHKDEALDLFLQAGAFAEDVFEIPFQAGRLCLENGDSNTAQTFFEKALQINPKAGGIFRYLGDSYAASGQTDAAISAYKKAVKHNPGDAASLSALGCLFDEQGENPEIAMVFCRESVGLSPENGLYRHRLGQLYLKLNELEEALKQFEEAERLGHGAAEVIREIKNQIEAKAS